jgi:hypothetical protein
MRFPELFDVSPAQSADGQAPEADAARDEKCLEGDHGRDW